MQPDTAAHLWDALSAATKVRALVDGLTLDDYLADWIRQSAAERQLEILGEALNRVRRNDADIAARIPDVHTVIAVRNIIVHRYDGIDHVRVWAMIHDDAPRLANAVTDLLAEFGPPS